MAAEKVTQEKLLNKQTQINGLEAGLSIESLESIPAVESNQDNNTPSVQDSRKEKVDRALRKAVEEGRVGYDSQKVKKRIEGNLSPKDAGSWGALIEGKQQGVSANN
mgnify:CR=1 FL=1